ncbi:RimK family alpha-L-glutamate ligase [Streptacidiphilus sp. N1-12]|uniref:RimK family alpha-L-glutamate ligase n=2 Tax=Streptacidiphilus alkalitolerans TaxID=3342712 RepID=A0ABV6WVH1_9ACTN
MTSKGRVVLATSTTGIERDSDMPLLLDALRERGVEAEAVRWDDPDYDWSGCTDVVVRSTWDYGPRLAEYLAWTDRVSAVARLHNPAEVVRWSSDKHYLRELAEQGVPVVPTAFLAPGEKVVLPGYEQFVVKPTVSAGARDTARYTADQGALAEAHVLALHAAGRTAMVQPYLARIAEGERALAFLGGAFSHALRKGPVLTDVGVIDNARVAHPDLILHQPSDAEREVAAAALRAAPRPDEILIARVDLALADDGTPLLMELELIEPFLFLGHTPAGLARFARTIEEWSGGREDA